MKAFGFAAVSILLAISSFAPSLQAAPITGSIDFGGVVTFDSTSLANATRVSLWNSSFVLQDSGDFSSIAPGTNVTMASPWIFSPSTSTPSLWSVGGFKFDLSSCVIVSQTSTFLNITGIGMISATGFDPTPGTWSFTASDSSGQPQATFGFQTQTAAVPEPGTLTLLAIGAGGLISARRRRARN
jgi:PEP-CTERM motif